jgi:hypothetical protein
VAAVAALTVPAAAAAGIGLALGYLLDLTHVAWAAAAAMFIMRPDPGLLASRAAGRTVATFAGVVAAALLLRGGPTEVALAVVTVAAIAATVAVRTSRWYVVPAGTALVVLLLSGVAGRQVFQISFAERLLETAIGAGLALTFGVAFPAAVREMMGVGADRLDSASAVGSWIRSGLTLGRDRPRPARRGRRQDMRVMLMIKGDPQPGAAPSEELLGAMGSYNDVLKEAGVLIDLAGLLPSAMGRRVRLSGGNRAVIEGPFAESKQLIAGYWILQVQSMDEAVEWAERFPFEAWSGIYPGEYGAEVELEIRQVFEPES